MLASICLVLFDLEVYLPCSIFDLTGIGVGIAVCEAIFLTVSRDHTFMSVCLSVHGVTHRDGGVYHTTLCVESR